MGYWFGKLEFWVLEIWALFFSSHEVLDELKPASPFFFYFYFYLFIYYFLIQILFNRLEQSLEILK